VFTAIAGYLFWGKKDLAGGNTVQPKAFSIFAGGKYYFTPGFHGSVEGGISIFTYTCEKTVVGLQGNTNLFMLPIGIGYPKSGFELGIRYMLLATNYNWFSFTLGYDFTP
jgi:hypothetical protein